MEENQLKIPDGWESNELGKLIIERKKSGLKVSDATNFGQYPFFTSGEAILVHNEIQIDGENIYLATGGVANIKYLNGEAAYSTDTYVVSTENEIETQYLYFGLLNILEYINTNFFQGSGLKHLQKKDLKKHLILYPENKNEQTQIASILSKVDEAITQTKQLITKYSRIKTGLMQDLLTKGIDENGNIRSEETHEFKDSPLGRMPQEWDIVKVEDLGDWKGGKTPRKSIEKYWEKANNLWFSSKDITSNLLNDSFYKISDSSISETNQTVFPAYKSLIFVFRSGILRHTFPIARSIRDFSINQDIKALIPKDDYDSEFLFYLFKSLEPLILSSFVKAGTTVESIDGRAFFGAFIGVPEEKEQKMIRAVLSKTDSKLTQNRQQLSKLQSLKTGLMQDLLSGKVRVNYLIKETAKT